MPILEWGDSSNGGGAGPTAGLAGPELLAHLEKTQPMVAAGVKGIYAGDVNAAGRNLQKLLPLTSLVYPDFQQQDYATRLATRKNYLAGGKQFQELQALNTVGGHLMDLKETADKLNNWEGMSVATKPLNWLTEYKRSLEQDPRLKDFHAAYTAVTNELAKAYHGGHVSDSAVRDWQGALNAASTPEEMRTVIGRLSHLLHSKIQASEEGYRVGMGKAPMPDEFSALSSRARDTFQKIGDWSMGVKPQGGATAAPGQAVQAPAAQAPVPGAKQAPDGNWYVQQNGKFFKVQP